MERPPRHPAAAALFLAGLVTTVPAGATGEVSFTAGEFEFEGIVVEGLAVDWALDPAAGSVTLRAARVSGLEATGPLAKIAVECARLHIEGDEFRCERGRLSGSLGSLGAQDSAFTARRSADGGLRIHFAAFAVAGGKSARDERDSKHKRKTKLKKGSPPVH